SKVADWLGLRRNLAILLIAVLVIGAGEELWMRFVPKYLQALGASVFAIGAYDGLRTVLAAVYAYPGGIAADAWGHRRAFMAFNIMSSRAMRSFCSSQTGAPSSPACSFFYRGRGSLSLRFSPSWGQA